MLDVILWILVDSVLDDMLGNTLEAPELRTELELAASNFAANKTTNTAKPGHNSSIRILISFVNGHITFDFLSGSSGLVVQLFVHLEIKYDRCFQAVLRPPFPYFHDNQAVFCRLERRGTENNPTRSCDFFRYLAEKLGADHLTLEGRGGEGWVGDFWSASFFFLATWWAGYFFNSYMLCRIFFSLLVSLQDFFFLKKVSCLNHLYTIFCISLLMKNSFINYFNYYYLSINYYNKDVSRLKI